MAKKRKTRVTQFSAQQIADGAMTVRKVAQSLEGIAEAMEEGGISEIPIDGFAQFDRGVAELKKFLGNASKGLQTARIDAM